MNPELDFDTNVERITHCRLSGEYAEARRLLHSLSLRAPSSLSTLQKNVIVIEKSELLTTIGLHKRAEKALRKAIRVSSHLLHESYDLVARSFAVLLGNMAFVRLHTKGKFQEGLRVEAELRSKFLETSEPDTSRIGLYVISCHSHLIR